MNRQVGPSIVCSVLIVCFFAVAFFPHDRRARPALALDGQRRAVRPRRAADRGRAVGRIEQPISSRRPAGPGVTGASVAKANTSAAGPTSVARSTAVWRHPTERRPVEALGSRDRHHDRRGERDDRTWRVAFTAGDHAEALAGQSRRPVSRTHHCRRAWCSGRRDR